MPRGRAWSRSAPCKARLFESRAFTFLELVVVLALMVVVFAITWRLVLDSQARLAHSSRRSFEMPVEQVFTLMRVDIRGSRSFTAPFMDDIWEYGPLDLSGHFSGDVVRYELVDRELRRVVYEPRSLDPKGQRPVLKEVISFRWRSLSESTQSALEVEVSYRETAALTRRRAAGQFELDPVLRTRNLIAMPRDVVRARWW